MSLYLRFLTETPSVTRGLKISRGRKAHRGAGAGLAVEFLQQGGVEAGGARQVVAVAAQHQVAQPAERLAAALRQQRHEQADELPPVAQRRPGQVLQAFDQ